MPDEGLIGADLILLLLAAPTDVVEAQGRINGVTRLEKLLFLAAKEEDINAFVEDDYEFVAYNFGPYSKKVYQEVEVLEQSGLVREERAYGGETLDEMEEIAATGGEREGIERRFSLTDEGRAVAELLGSRNPEAVAKLGRIKDEYARMPLARLVRYVYRSFPEYAEKSLIRDKVLRRPHGES